MASTPRQRALLRAMTQLAQEEVGPGATPLDWVVQRLEDGLTVTKVAARVGEALGENWDGSAGGPWIPSRAFLSNVMRWVYPDTAKERMAAARKVGATSLAEDALGIVDECSTATTASVQKARLQSDTRLALAAAFDPEKFGTRSVPQVNISLGDLHILAVQRAPRLGLPASERQPQQQVEPMPAEIVGADELPALAGGTED